MSSETDLDPNRTPGDLLSEQIEYRRASGGAFVAAWYPAIEPFRASLVDWASDAAAAGADLVAIELPSADGLFFDSAGEALCRMAPESIGVEGVLDLLAAGRLEIDAPVLLIAYARPLLDLGIDRLAEQGIASGLDAIAVVDGESDDGSGWIQRFRTAGLRTVHAAVAGADRRRTAALAEAHDGLVWCQDPFDPFGDDLRAQLRAQRRLAKRTGTVVLTDPSEVPLPRTVRRLGGVLLRRLGAARLDAGDGFGDAMRDAVREVGGERS